jgi:peptidoglycan/LPS O-acetylase OafA/YrhL
MSRAITVDGEVSSEPLTSLASPAESRNLSLDGLRGVAVLLVLLHHHHYLNAGWMGVDLFFVLSGYLITSILRSTRTDKYFWSTFWIKRFARILPPLVLLLLATRLLRFSLTWPQALAYFFSFGDVLAHMPTTLEPLRSLWSLAVEEHFYMFWPFAVRLLPRRQLIFILLSVIISQPIIRSIATVFHHDWQLVYYLTPFRLDGLALGSLLSLGLESPIDTQLLKRWSGAATALFIAVWMGLRIFVGLGFTRDNPTVIYNGACYSLVSLAAFSFIAYLLLHQKSIAARALTWKPLVFTGTISYGLYLYQALIREAVTRTWHISDRSAFWIDTPVIFVVAWLSFYLYEKPIMRWGRSVLQTRLRSGCLPDEQPATSTLVIRG